MSNNIKIAASIKIEIDNKKIDLSYEEAKELYNKLGIYFHSQPFQFPIYETIKVEPYYGSVSCD